MSTPVIIRERDQDDDDVGRHAKRQKTDEAGSSIPVLQEVEAEQKPAWDHVLPPSHSLLGIPLPEAKPNTAINFSERDVGISEYVGSGEAKVEGIIKQRCVNCKIWIDWP
jgi:tRNA pseudouridine13 synthase